MRAFIPALSLVGALTFLNFAHAQEIEFPEEELATESVLPVFDKTVVVRERAVKTEGRFEVGLGMGLNLAEPLYNQFTYDITATYHLSEIHGVNLYMAFPSTELSGAGKDLSEGKGLTNRKFNASYAPTLESLIFGNYQFTAYYGKMNATKYSTMNLSLYGLVGVGMANWSDASEFAADFGVGQKLYFTPNFGLRIDLFVAMYAGPDPTAPKTQNNDLQDPEDGTHGFDTTYYIRPFLTGSLIYLF